MNNSFQLLQQRMKKGTCKAHERKSVMNDISEKPAGKSLPVSLKY